MIVYSTQKSSRLSYVLDYLLRNRLGIAYQITTDEKLFAASNLPKINYNERDFDQTLSIEPSGLLFEHGINQTKPTISRVHNLPVLFQTTNNSSFSFDIFSAVFWMLSRYEEYQHFTPDKYGRFGVAESLTGNMDLHRMPLVDLWVHHFKDVLRTRYPDLKLKKNDFQFIPSIDVDSPWCYKHKGWVRNILGFTRDLFKGKTADLKLRYRVLLGKEKDPWDQFEFLDKAFENQDLDPIYFILIGNYGRNDKSVNHRKKAFSKLIFSLSKKYTIGLHPSYSARNSMDRKERERSRLEGISKNKITAVRQHYLSFSLPTYYQQLIKMGINHDYSMGFADDVGFRAGTSGSFLFYDLNKEETTNLLVHPFVIMDVTLNNYLKLKPEEASKLVEEIMDSVVKVDGTFVSLWHNESLSEKGNWKNWRIVFEQMLEYAKNAQHK